MLNVVKVTKTHFLTVLPRIVNLSKKSSYLCFAHCSKWGQAITSSISLLSVANMIKIVVYHSYAQGSKFGQIPLILNFAQDGRYDQNSSFLILFPILAKLIKYHLFCIFVQSWLKYLFFKILLKIANLIKTLLSTCFLF